MIEIHTRIFCACGQRFYHMLTGDVPLPKTLEITATCPFCGNENRAKYEFDANFQCRKWWRPWEKHCITAHFTKNEGNTDNEIFPRKCNCGEEILLNQRRI